MDVPDDLRPAEQRLLAALHAGKPCDLLDDRGAPTSDEIATWDDPARIVRADVLRAVLLDQYPQIRPKTVELRGAIIDGDLKLTGDLRPSVRLHHCCIANASFDGATSAAPTSCSGCLRHCSSPSGFSLFAADQALNEPRLVGA